MRLIDADAFDRDLCDAKFSASLNRAYDENRAFEDEEMWYSTQSFRDVMKYRPTVDAVPVVHGKWQKINNPNYSPFDGSAEHISICSVCGYMREQYDFRYCPHCGALMDGKKDEQDADGA